jgi:hypothetical protein
MCSYRMRMSPFFPDISTVTTFSNLEKSNLMRRTHSFLAFNDPATSDNKKPLPFDKDDPLKN